MSKVKNNESKESILLKVEINDTNKHQLDTTIKMYVIVNNSLKMGTGKIAGQCCHAVAGLTRRLENSKDTTYKEWKKNYEPKIILKASEEFLLHILEKYPDQTYEVRDIGKTQIVYDSLTVVGVVPLNPDDKLS